MQHEWDRRDAESSRAYFCFLNFLNSGADRTVIASFRQITGKPQARQVAGAWNAWVLKYAWQERAAAWDSHQQQLADEERRKLARADEKKWAERRRALREREFAVSEQLITTAEAILAQPALAEQQHAARMMQLGMDLQRRATEMEKHAGDEQTEQTGAKVIRFPVAVASADEWAAQYKKKA